MMETGTGLGDVEGSELRYLRNPLKTMDRAEVQIMYYYFYADYSSVYTFMCCPSTEVSKYSCVSTIWTLSSALLRGIQASS